MKVSEIVIATGGKLISGDETMEITGFSQDSRQAEVGMMYIPIIGERYDGHNFIESAFTNGASAIITDRLIEDDKHVVILVDNTLKLCKRWLIIYGNIARSKLLELLGAWVKQAHVIWFIVLLNSSIRH